MGLLRDGFGVSYGESHSASSVAGVWCESAFSQACRGYAVVKQLSGVFEGGGHEVEEHSGLDLNLKC